MTPDLFGSNDPGGPPPPHDAPPGAGAPLADRMRPRSFDELVGQPHLLEAGTPLALMREGGHLASIVLWGPPGSGKTTIARLIARTAQVPFVAFSAVLSGVKEVKETMVTLENELSLDVTSLYWNVNYQLAQRTELYSIVAYRDEAPQDAASAVLRDVNRFSVTVGVRYSFTPIPF